MPSERAKPHGKYSPRKGGRRVGTMERERERESYSKGLKSNVKVDSSRSLIYLFLFFFFVNIVERIDERFFFSIEYDSVGKIGTKGYIKIYI